MPAKKGKEGRRETVEIYRSIKYSTDHRGIMADSLTDYGLPEYIVFTVIGAILTELLQHKFALKTSATEEGNFQ
uniref:Uncharacterized protein n=1 Tax=Romanomermis culicivorax TaxID=13658 RepID=A0A915J274_ROMCU